MVTNNLENIRALTKGKTLVAATKYVDSSVMEELLAKGIHDFGENRVDAFLKKYQELKNHEEIVWHFIGNLQTNKVKKMINKIDYLHSLNSLHLAKYIEEYRFKPLNCFLEINLTESETKQGMKEVEVIPFLEKIKDYQHIKVIGLMTMTEKSQTKEEKIQTFQKLQQLSFDLQKKGYLDIKELSMGMSEDFELALENGATFVRLGRILFTE